MRKCVTGQTFNIVVNDLLQRNKLIISGSSLQLKSLQVGSSVSHLMVAWQHEAIRNGLRLLSFSIQQSSWATNPKYRSRGTHLVLITTLTPINQNYFYSLDKRLNLKFCSLNFYLEAGLLELPFGYLDLCSSILIELLSINS